MKFGVARRILESHRLSGSLEPGAELTIKVDQTLTQDATGTMACLELEAMGPKQLKTELSVSYVDHNMMQEGFENADDHKYLQTIAARYRLYYSRGGNGICHQVHLERFARPGKVLLGSDSHTPMAGGMASLAVGAGGLDVALAMAKGEFTMTAPRVMRVHLKGKLPEWSSAKDVILEMLRRFTTKGNVGWVMEYAGGGVSSLSVFERATITNMGAELGVTTSIFPSDKRTRTFLTAQGRAQEWVALTADAGAYYDREETLDLHTIEPLAAAPHSPGNVATVCELSGLPVDQVCIGSCTNSSYADLMTAAKILEGRRVHSNVSLIVAPGSRQVFAMIARSGALASLVASGARIDECACGFCIGAGQAPRTDAVSLRTSNRNFLGRSGTKSANVYLVSPAVAAAAAVTGEMTDPRTLSIAPPKIRLPRTFIIDDSMIIPPREGAKDTDIYRGPNIGAPPVSQPLKDSLDGQATIKVGDKVTTDHIMPAGTRMKYRSNVPKYAEFVFENTDPDFAARAVANRKEGRDNFIIAGLSYGQGSSREHAAICPMHLGVRAVVAKSIERIHHANLINFGILPALFADPADYDCIEQGDRLKVPDLRKRIADAQDLLLLNCTKDIEIPLECRLNPRERRVLLAGGMLNMVRSEK